LCLTMDNSAASDMLPLNVGRAIAYGLDEQAAFEAITINPATLLGLADRIGSIEVGKDADLAMFTGHPFSSLSKCELVMIDGVIYKN
ncbi:MAG: amidohydrolase family protein, partial [Clostridia bacterium]|nr:amidohydrolase family protein [Clostridia bacterium]